jgi:hypothetical protein
MWWCMAGTEWVDSKDEGRSNKGMNPTRFQQVFYLLS